MTKVKPYYFVAGPDGTSGFDTEADAVQDFRSRPKAVRVVRTEQALLRSGPDDPEMFGLPRQVWTNRNADPSKSVLIVERVGDRELWPSREMHPGDLTQAEKDWAIGVTASRGHRLINVTGDRPDGDAA